jgi:hypothetical protein
MQTPLNTLQLSAFLHDHLNLSIASRALIDGHQAPLEYLSHVFFQGRGGFGAHGLAHPPRALDSVVWASRGGGKTFLGAVATALDLVFKPGISIRILGGSLDQSKRMHAYLRTLFADGPLADLVEGPIRDSRLALTNGSEVELLAQSHTSVRGTRVQTLRCDEVELFREDVFDAAMLATRSKVIDIPGVGPTEIAGSIECMSTMHVPFGLMSRLVKDNTRRVFKWGVVDVLAECEKTRECSECELWTECRGKAKRVDVGCGMSDGGCEENKAKGNQHGEPPRATEEEHGEETEKRSADVQSGRAAEIGTNASALPSVLPLCQRGRWPRTRPEGVSDSRGETVKAKRGARSAECGTSKQPSTKSKGRFKKRSKVRSKTQTKVKKTSATKRQKPATKAKQESSKAVVPMPPVPHSESRVPSSLDIPHPTSAIPHSPGHLSIDDAVRMKRRVSLPQWNTEMLCLEPSRADSVFPEFDPKKHVFRDWEDEALFSEAPSLREGVGGREGESPVIADLNGSLRLNHLPEAPRGIDAQASSLLLAKREQERRSCGELWVCGIDFGFRAPTVILWGAVEAHTRVLRILDERIVERATTKEHVEAIFKGNGRGWKLPDFVGVDPAGKQVQSQTGIADAKVLSESGLDVQAKSLGIGRGLHLIRARLAPAEGPVRLFVHVRCRGLIEALTKYHYRVDAPEDPEPVKDGSDHAVDALRYMVLNLDVGKGVACSKY